MSPNARATTQRGQTAGYSVLELLIGMIAAAILALTAGAIVFSGYLGWGRGLQAVEMHRDAGAAMALLNAAVRPTAAADVVATGTDVLTLRTNGVTYRIRRNAGGDLLFSPNVGGGAELVVVAGRVSQFATATLGGTASGIQVQIVLQDATANETTQITSTIAHRN